MFFVAKDNIPTRGGELAARAGDRVSRADLAGCDIAWLVKCKAIVPVGGVVGASLLSDDPSKEELIEEVGRLQGIIEDQSKGIDSMHAEIRDLRELRDKALQQATGRGFSPEVPADRPESPGELETLRDRTRAQEATITSLSEQLTASRERLDKYASRVTDLERDLRESRAATPAETPAEGV